MIQVNAWVRTDPGDLAAIMNRVEEILIPDTVDNTGHWEKISETAPWDPNSKTHHGSQRFGFRYYLTDGATAYGFIDGGAPATVFSDGLDGGDP